MSELKDTRPFVCVYDQADQAHQAHQQQPKFIPSLIAIQGPPVSDQVLLIPCETWTSSSQQTQSSPLSFRLVRIAFSQKRGDQLMREASPFRLSGPDLYQLLTHEKEHKIRIGIWAPVYLNPPRVEILFYDDKAELVSRSQMEVSSDLDQKLLPYVHKQFEALTQQTWSRQVLRSFPVVVSTSSQQAPLSVLPPDSPGSSITTPRISS